MQTRNNFLSKRNIADLLNFSGSENDNNSEETKHNQELENYEIYNQRSSNPFELIPKQKLHSINNDSIKEQDSSLPNKIKETDQHNFTLNKQKLENYVDHNANKEYQLTHEDIKIEIDNTRTN